MLKDRISMIFLRYGHLDVIDGAFVLVDQNGVRTHIPVGSVACIMLEPGTRVSHAAVKLASVVGTLLVWVGEAGVRLYSSGQPGGARSDKLLYQARLALDKELRLRVVQRMYELRFKERPDKNLSVQQLMGIEGFRVKETYRLLAQKYRVTWHGRRYDPKDWEKVISRIAVSVLQPPVVRHNRSCSFWRQAMLPAIGFIHSGKPLSFVYDIADIIKFDAIVPKAFEIAAQKPPEPDRVVRLACRDIFRRTKLTERIIPMIENVLAAGGIALLNLIKICGHRRFLNLIRSETQVIEEKANDNGGRSYRERSSKVKRQISDLAVGSSSWCIRGRCF